MLESALCNVGDASRQEAELIVFPAITPEMQEKSVQLAQRFAGVAKDMGNPQYPYCFLVDRDLSTIEPFAPHYPIHQLWNAYSPFETMPLREISRLDELKAIQLPDQKKDI